MLDIQSELVFINGMVYLPQKGNFGTPTSFPSPATPPSVTFHSNSKSAYMMSRVQYTTYKIIARCIELTTALWPNNTHVTRKYKAM